MGEQPTLQLFLISQNEAVCCSPGGRFHGWLFRRHADGSFVSDRKLQETSPYPIGHPLATLLGGDHA